MLARFLWHYALAKRNYGLSVSELRRLQDKKLRRIIHHAYDHVPLYHNWLRSRGLTPADIRGVDDLRLLPKLTKDEIMKNFPEGILASNKNLRRVVKRTTTGTTGPPLHILYDVKYSDIAVALRVAARSRATGVSFWDKVANVMYVGQDPGNDRNGKNGSINRLSKLFFGPMTSLWLGPRAKALGITNDLRDSAHNLFERKPNVIYGRASYLRRVGGILKDEGLQLHASSLITSGEFLSNACRLDLKDLYKGDVYDEYGSNEFGTLGNECSQHSGIHLNSDYFIFESLTRDGEPALPGEAGEVFITCLDNETMPLIRYKQGDIIVLEDEGRCDCGSNLPRIRSIQGRPDDGIVSKDKVRVPPGQTVDYMESLIGLRDYQLIQVSQHEVVVKLKPEDSLKPEVMKGLSSYLKSVLGEDMRMEIESCKQEEFPVKYRPVISKVAT